MEDLRALNAEYIKRLSLISPEELRSRIDSVSVPTISGDPERAAGILDREGIVIVPDFIGAAEMDEAASALERLAVRCKEFLQSNETSFEDDQLVMQKGSTRVIGYKNMANHEKPVVQVRTGQDQGMVDIFNIDRLLGSAGHSIRQAFCRQDVRDLISGSRTSVSAGNMNAYMNNGVTATRGFHVDTYKERIKAFIYASDVLNLDDGPYVFVKGSHKCKPIQDVNRKLSGELPNPTEAPVLPFDSVVPALAGKGALIISDQSGIHRGHPQAEGATRRLFVMSYQ